MSIVYLRVKIRSLAEEARIIRSEERRLRRPILPTNDLFFGLRRHRVYDVRRETRASLLAYGLLRGRTYNQLEKTARQGREAPDVNRVRELIQKYGADRNLPIRDKVALGEFISAWMKDGTRLQRAVAA
jgi:hypothetical protein